VKNLISDGIRLVKQGRYNCFLKICHLIIPFMSG
jgi:hypothetical protein